MPIVPLCAVDDNDMDDVTDDDDDDVSVLHPCAVDDNDDDDNDDEDVPVLSPSAYDDGDDVDDNDEDDDDDDDVPIPSPCAVDNGDDDDDDYRGDNDDDEDVAILSPCVGDDNDEDDNDEDDNDDDDDDDYDDVDVPVLSSCAGDELGREDLAADVVPAFHHSAKLPPGHDLDEFENFVDNCYNHDYDHCDGQSPTGGAFSISGGFVSGIGKSGQWAESARGVEIFDQVFPGNLFNLRYFRVCQVFPSILGISEYFGYLSYT